MKGWVIFVIFATLWSVPWKGVALGKAARNGQLNWFIALLVINTLAILEIIYLKFFQRKRESGAG